MEHNLMDYEDERRGFSWRRARRELLDGLPGDRGLNIAHETVDRHASSELAGRTAMLFVDRQGVRRSLSYLQLALATNRFANVLHRLDLRRGERVFGLADRVPELYIAALGTLKSGCLFCPLFSAFGPEPVRQRLELGNGAALITTERLFVRKVAPILDTLPDLRHVLLIDGEGEAPAGTLRLRQLMAEASESFEIPPTDPEDMALLHFTSGTTGTPKGAVHVHEAILAHHATGGYALDFRPEDRFWCTADPGWVTGTSYGILSPLSHGLTQVIYQGDFDAESWYRLIQDERITVWYTAPTAIRMLMRAGGDLAKEFDLSSLRLIASVGEALNPEAIRWGEDTFGMPILDNWWQTETGGIMIANYPSMPVRPGSMGRPMPGIEAGVLSRDDGGSLRECAPGSTGELAIRPGWPSMFRGYLGQQERYRACFEQGWYLSGDLARCDEDGYFWFVGRGDDVIKSSGHLIGPFEVESALLEHPAVAEAAVIGKPDAIVGERVKAFVSLTPGQGEEEALLRQLQGHARRRLGAAVAPKEIEILDQLPRTRSGKIMRRLLKARELGLPEGDLSTLERAPENDLERPLVEEKESP